MQGGIVGEYMLRAGRGEIETDAAQIAAAGRLDDLASVLGQQGASRRLFSGFGSRRTPAPRGIYLYGAVGRGKTMLMDLFHERVAFAPKLRMHFHAFMAATHERIQRGRATTDGDPIPFVAAELAGEAALLCLDEFHVNDIADAMILSRLFKSLFERKVVLVATSNSPPSALYPNGLNRQLFLPFIAMLEERLDLVEVPSAKDFRLSKLAGRPLYFCPVGPGATAGLDGHWQRLTGHHPAEPVVLSVKGRQLKVPRASMGVARFDFAELCERPLGAADYLALAHTFHTLIIDSIPRLGPERRNEARRFVTLIDTLYDSRVSLIVSAEAEPHELYPAGDGAQHFERTASRLVEMRSEAYLARERPPAAAIAASRG
ncbi:MAG: cell division protein ZapE [Hyphomicrobium sp.]